MRRNIKMIHEYKQIIDRNKLSITFEFTSIVEYLNAIEEFNKLLS